MTSEIGRDEAALNGLSRAEVEMGCLGRHRVFWKRWDWKMK